MKSLTKAFACLASLLGASCTAIVGLPDVPDPIDGGDGAAGLAEGGTGGRESGTDSSSGAGAAEASPTTEAAVDGTGPSSGIDGSLPTEASTEDGGGRGGLDGSSDGSAGACTCTLPNANSSCDDAGQCRVTSCNPGFANCDNNDANGCEANTTTDWRTCGGCMACQPGYRCQMGSCIQGLNVLLVSGFHGQSPLDDVKSKLTSAGGFQTIDEYDLQGSGTPILQNLARYDALLVWVPAQFSSNPELGTVLVDYFNGGGTVVTGLGVGGAGFSGPFAQLYMFIQQQTEVNCPSCALGTVMDPTSPLMTGVASFGVATGAVMYIVPGTLQNNGQVVASWSNGTPMIVAGVINGRKRVDLNINPVSDTVDNNGWHVGTDGARLLKNALLYR